MLRRFRDICRSTIYDLVQKTSVYSHVTDRQTDIQMDRWTIGYMAINNGVFTVSDL